MGKIIKFIFSIIILSSVGLTLMGKLGFVPDTKVVPGSELSDGTLEDLMAKGLLVEGESIQYFYSEDLTSFVDYGNFFTEDRIVSYELDESGEELLIYTATYQEVSDIQFLDAESSLEDAYIEIYTGEEDPSFYLVVSTEEDLDEVFFSELVKNWKAKKSSI